jgi:NHLM bacteriocin system ABC transporter ATP-binding protein
MDTTTSTVPPTGALETRTSFGLTGDASVWIVRTGSIHIFVVNRVDGIEAGALRPLFELTAGQAAFGMPNLPQSTIALVARRDPESEVAVWPIAAIRESSRLPGERMHDFRTLVAGWCSALSRAAAADVVPRALEWAQPAMQVVTADDSRRISARESLIWIRQDAGESSFLGHSDLRIRAGTGPYPLAPGAWIDVQPKSSLSVIDGPPDGDDSFGWELEAFYADAFTCIASNLLEADARERQRFLARSVADARAVRSALEELASPLASGETRDAAGGPEPFDIPLLRACSAIGKVLGITFRADPDMVRGRPVNQPVAAIARASGLRVRRVVLKDRWSTRAREPLLVFRDADNAPAALLPRRKGYAIYDPEAGTTTPLDSGTAAALNPFAFMFYRPFPQKALTITDLLSAGLRGSRRELLTILSMGAAAGLLAVLVPYISGVVFDSVIPNAQRSALFTIGALLVAAALVSSLFNLARGFALLRLQGTLSLALEAALWDRLLSLPLPFFRAYAAGDLAQRSAAITEMRSILSGSLLGALLSGVFSVFSFGLLFFYSPRLALIATAMTALAIAVTIVAGTLQLRLHRDISAAAGRIAGMVVELISGISRFRVAGAERRAFVMWVRAFAAQKRTDVASRRINTLMAVFYSVYIAACIAVLFFAHSSGSRSNALSTGQFLAFMTAFGQFMGAALGMAGALLGVAAVVPLYERAAPILHTLPEVTTDQAAPGELKGGIEANHLVFQYHPEAPLVLRDVSFQIHPGEYVAFVGPSGSGKSTVFRLLLGFDKPVSGSVLYDGVELAGLDAVAVRRQIGVVLQHGTLVAGTIAENIAGAASFPLDDIWEAARAAGLDEDIRAMPMGMHTMLQSGGGGVSGGQRQRVLIARAIVARPRLLLFDEATSALDNRTQAIVIRSLEKLKATRIVIAHRLSTIMAADRIFVMDHGRIVQSGTYAELMDVPGLFRELAERQLT